MKTTKIARIIPQEPEEDFKLEIPKVEFEAA